MSGIEIKEYSLYLFDLDDTITKPIKGKIFPETEDDRMFLPGRQSKLDELHAAGKKIAIVSNQGGAAWGMVRPEVLDAALKALLRDRIDAYFICYRDTSEKARASERTDKTLTVPEYYKDWNRRKPGPGMLIEAMEHFGVDRHDTLMVGDRNEDKGAAEAAGVSFEWAWDFFGDGPIIV